MTMKFSKIHVDIVDTFEKFQGERVKNFSQFVVENLDPALKTTIQQIKQSKINAAIYSD